MKRQRYLIHLCNLPMMKLGDGSQSECPVFQPRWARVGDAITVRHGARVFGSRTEAKRVLTKLSPAWPDAKIVPEVRS